MNKEAAGMTDLRTAKYRTAAVLAAFALGLFVFTLYSGLK
jgi:hypothetical protein